MTDSEFRALFAAHQDSVYRFAYRMLGGSEADAEDVAQEVFLAVWRKPAGYDAGRGAMRAYLLGIARNRVLKKWRASHPEDPLDEESPRWSSGPGEPVDWAAMERRQAVAEAVSRLPLLQREALVLGEYEGMSLEEVALVTGVAVGAVKSRQHRARQNLKKMLAPVLGLAEMGDGVVA